MDLEQLQAFLTVARTKNFTRAAEELHVVQSTITARIKMLEQSVGKALFKRQTRNVDLTFAGELFLPYVEQVLELMRDGVASARLQPDFKNRLVIGGLNSIWDSSLFSALQQFHQQHREIAIRVITDHSDRVIARVQNGTVDLGLVYLPPTASAIAVMPIKEESLRLVGTPNLVATIGSPSLRELFQYPFIHYNWGPPFEEWFAREVGSHNAAGFRIDHTGAFVRLLLQGEGVGFLLSSIADEYIEKGRLQDVAIKMANQVPKRTIYLIFKEKNRQLEKIKSFLDDFLTSLK